MAYPNKIPRSRNRRAAARGQTPTGATVTATATGSASTAVVTFSQPVNVSGPLPLAVATLTYVSQVINSPTQVTVTFSAAVATHAYTWTNPMPTVSSYQGGPVLGVPGTF